MDTSIRSRKALESDHFQNLHSFIKKILALKSSERLNYFKTITNTEIDFICEIITNFLHKKIPSDYRSYSLLEKIKDFLRKFIKTKKGYKLKKKLILTLKGLHMIAVLFPLALNFLS